MIYTCPVCGEGFSSKDIKAAMEGKNGGVITCKYCTTPTQVKEAGRSKTSQGYDYLSVGDFHRAEQVFQQAMRDASHHGKTPSADTYLGEALAQLHVQVVFSEEGNMENPELTCHYCNDIYLVDTLGYEKAIEIIDNRQFEADYHELRDRVEYYADYVDGVKDCYNKIAQEKGFGYRYNAFIAYEDESDDEGMHGFDIAERIKNNLPDQVKNAFLPDIEKCNNDKVYYEASILYAIDHSNCMLVVADNNIDARLTDIYTRFYNRSRTTDKEGKNLGFVLYRGEIVISLPDNSVVEDNAFYFGKPGYNDFVLTHNGYFVEKNKPEGAEEKGTQTEEERQAKPIIVSANAWLKMINNKQIIFGSYPQEQDTSDVVRDYFDKLPKPDIDENNGWKVLFFGRNHIPHTWYRDEVIGGAKYRAVYFIKFRDVYTIQKADVKTREQNKHGYFHHEIYCFKFTPLIWDIEMLSGNIAVLVSNQGVDSREYNCEHLDNDWYDSSLRFWLNNTFIDEAFDENEQERLCFGGGDDMDDKVFLPDKNDDKVFYVDRKSAIVGTDYYRCIGGMGDKGINSCWIKDCDCHHGKDALVLSTLLRQRLSKMYVDCSSVAVVPKIYLKIK